MRKPLNKNLTIEKNMIDLAKKIGDNVKDMVSVSNAIVPVSEETVSRRKTSPLMTEALDSSFSSREELKAKKILAAALIVAKSNGCLPSGIPNTIDGIAGASLADESLTRMKAGYQVATGEIDISEAIDILVDRAVARTMAISDIMVKRGVDMAINVVGEMIVSAYPETRPIVTLAKVFQPFITEKAQKFARTGIKMIGEAAKKCVRSLSKMAVSVARKVSSPRILTLFS